MLEKRAKTEHKMPIEALYLPNKGVWELFNTSQIKVASIDKTQPLDLGGFDLKAAVTKNPENLFVKVFAIKANEVNDNGDCFSESELQKSAHTFVGVPVFVNHQNDNVENARGKVVHSWYDEAAKGVYCINMVDRNAYPRLARGIEEGYITGTSMGAQVGFSLCSICHNKAHTAEEFCSHVKGGKNRKISGKFDCKYHASACKPQEDCPLDGKKMSETKELLHKEARVYEWNYDIKFIEDSFVVNPACHDCLVCDILNVDLIKEKFSSKIESLKKVASALNDSVAKMTEGSLEKTAGQTEIQALNQAMDLMEHVARSMMAQKQQVQLDYVSDLVEQIAKTQSLLDELVEMGYGQLASPSDQQIALGTIMSLSPNLNQPQSQQVMNPNQVGGQQPQQQPRQNPSSGAASSMGELGSITRPSFAATSEELKKDFTKQAENISNTLLQASVSMRSSLDLLDRRRAEVAKFAHEYEDGNIKITIASVDDSGEIHVGNWKDGKLVRWASINEFGDDIKDLAKNNPQEAAKQISSQYQKESGVTMSKINKIAAGDSDQQSVTTQKQLDKAGPLHPREDTAPTVTTQAQLDGEGELKPLKDTTSLSNQVRMDNIRETVTQDQIDSIKDAHVVRWGEYPEVITEAQWTEISRRVCNTLPSDYTSQTTQAQLASLQESHKWTPVEVTTQKQLDDQKKVSPEGKSDSYRWASSAKDLVKAASSAVADAIANYSLTPEEVASTVNYITASPQSSIKASYLTLVNAAPSKIEARIAERKRRNYFAKSASTNNAMKPVDALLASMADNIGYLKAEDFIDAINFVISDKKAFASAEGKAQVKLASRDNNTSVSVDKNSLFRQAFAELDRPEDGIYKINGTLTEDVKIDPANKVAFMNGLVTFASSHIDVPFVISNVNLDKEAGVFEIECKEEGKCSDQEKKAFASALAEVKTAKRPTGGFGGNGDDSSTLDDDGQPIKKTKAVRKASREQLVKEAQMMGGQMGGGMGGGGPQGGMGSTMPGADAAQGQAPTENLGGPPAGAGDEMEDPMGDDSDMQPKPPGTLCPVCGSSDCDVLDGKSKCNNCSAEWNIKVDMEITKYPGLLDSGKGEEGGGELGDENTDTGSGEGFALPEASDPASIPVAAMTQMRPEMIKKASEDFKSRGLVWSPGVVSPYTGSTSVMKLSENKFMCLDTGRKYEVHLAGVESKGKKAIFAEWRYDAAPLVDNCQACRRKKSSFVSSLKTHGVTEVEFDAMTFKDKGKTILAMQQKGLLKTVKTASSESVLNGLKKFAGFGSKFPIETCREKIARKYGENALALSGPCEGEQLADCVCKKLSTAGVYSNSVALKLASTWAVQDQNIECVEDFVRTGLPMKKACFVCDQLKAKYAQFEDHLSNDLSSPDESPMEPTPGEGGDLPGDSHESGGMDDMDPFAADQGAEGSLPGETSEVSGGDSLDGAVGGESPLDASPEVPSAPAPAPASAPGAGGGLPNGTVVLEIPLSALQQLDEALDKAKGENPAEEAHHESPLSGEAVIEAPVGAINELDQVADQALDAAVGVADGAVDAVEDAVSEAPGATDSDPVTLEGDEKEISSEEGESKNPFESSESSESSEGSEDSSEEKEDSSPSFENEGEDSKKELAMAQAESATSAFKKGKISSTGEINLDLSGVLSVLAKQGKSVKTAAEVSYSPAQNDKDIGKIKGDSTIGHEEKFDAAKPEVFSGDATMGGEKDAGYNNSKPKASFDSGGAEMGAEAEAGYKAEKQHSATGGDKGAGKSTAASNSTKARTASMAERIVNIVNKKTASDKKVEEAKPVSETDGIGEYSANKDNPKSGNPIKPFEEGTKLDKSDVQQGDASLMGHEKETLVNVSKEDNSAPSIPAGGGTNPKYDKNDKNSPEKETARKGTVIAGSDEETLAARKKEATRVAGRKLKAGKISTDDLAAEIEKLSRYELSDLRDIENSIFGATKKGFDTVAKGSERALVISERSNQHKTPGAELKDLIQGMFSLDKQNLNAEDNPTTEIRRLNNRR